MGSGLLEVVCWECQAFPGTGSPGISNLVSARPDTQHPRRALSILELKIRELVDAALSVSMADR